MNFASDNAVGASPSILDAIVQANHGAVPSYGADTLTKDAEAALRAWFEHDVAVFFVATGTAANALAIGALTPPWGAVLSHVHSHLANDECGAPEFFAGGAKLLLVEGDAGKMTPHGVADAMMRASPDRVRQSPPVCLSVSQATEAGTLYTLDELHALTSAARMHGLTTHMDGARFANALVSLGCSPADMTWRAGVDVLSLGASKNGALACEAIVFFDADRAKGFAQQRKRGGHTWSKGRFLGAQMLAWLADEHWRVLAAHSNAQAARLAAGLAGIPGVSLPWPCEINEVFAVLPRSIREALHAGGAVFHDWQTDALPPPQRPNDDQAFVRLVTSFATDPADVHSFVVLAQSAAPPAGDFSVPK